MANDKIDVVVGKKAFDEVGKLKIELEGLIKTFNELYALTKQSGGNPFGLPKQGTAKAAKKGLTELEKASRTLTATNEKLAISENKIVIELARKREELRITNLKTKQSVQENSKLVGAYGNLTAKLARLRREYKDVAAAEGVASKNAQKLAKQVRVLDSSLKKVDASAGQFQRNVGNYSKGFAGMARSLRGLMGAFGLVGGIYLFATAIRDTFQRIREFDKAMQNIAGVMRTTRSEIADLEKTIIQVAGSSVRTSNEVAALAESLTTLGKTKKEVQDLLKPVIDLSIGLEASADEAGEFLVAMLNTFGASSDEAMAFADTIASIRTSTSLNFQGMVDSFQYLAPISRSLGRDLAYTGSLVGILSDNGIKAQRAGRLLGTAQLRLAEDGLTLNDALEQVNKSIDGGGTALENSAVASKLFGAEASALGIILANNSEIIEKNAQEIRDNGGALDDLVNEQLKSLDAQLNILNSTWESFIFRLENGDGAFSRFIAKGLEGLTEMVKAFDELNKTDSDRKADAEEAGTNLGKQFVDITNRSPMTDENKRIAIDEQYLRITSDLNKSFAERAVLLKNVEKAQAEVTKLNEDDNIALFFEFRAKRRFNIAERLLKENAIILNKQRGELLALSNEQLKGVETEQVISGSGSSSTGNQGTVEEQEKKKQKALLDTFELRKFLIEEQIKISDAIFEDEERNDDDRLTQLSYRYAKEQELAKLNYDKDIKEKGISSTRKELIDAQYESEKSELELKFFNDRIDLLKLEELTIEQLLKNREGVLETSFQTELDNLNKLLLDKEITEREHEKRILQMKKDYALQVLEMEIQNLAKLLDNKDLNVSDRTELEGKLASATAAFSDLKVANAKDASEEIIDLNSEEFRQAVQLLGELGNFGSTLFDARIQRVDDEIQRNNDKYANILDNENLTVQQRDAIEAERDAKNAILEKKRRDEQRKQAVFNRSIAIVEIGIQTAVNIVNAGLNPVLIALAAAIGAAQLAAVIATPIPRFKDGKRKGQGKDGMALVNDGGRDEIKLSADGTMTRYSGRNVLDYVKSSDTIIPNADSYMRDLNRASVMASLQNNGANLSNSSDRMNFDMAMYNIESKMESGIKKGFKGVRMNIVNNIKTGNKDAYIASKMM